MSSSTLELGSAGTGTSLVSSAIKPDETVGGGGGGDTYTVIHITPLELELAVGIVGTGALTIAGYICATSWTGIGAAACVGVVGAGIWVVSKFLKEGDFPTLYIWWNTTTSSYGWTNVVW